MSTSEVLTEALDEAFWKLHAPSLRTNPIVISAGAPSAQGGFPPFAGNLGNTFGIALCGRFSNVTVAPAPDNILSPNT